VPNGAPKGFVVTSAIVTGGFLRETLQPTSNPQTFPLRYLSPQGRVSVRISEKIRWNAGYQYYGYHEDFSGLQNYRAHTGYTSVLWAF
jgi:hypothetical protein